MPRAYFHDYRQRCIYHITITKAPHVMDFGRLVGSGREAAIERSVLGTIIARHIKRIPELNPKLRVLQYIIMPDHIHLLLFATEELELPLGNYIGMFKVRVGQNFRDGYGGQPPVFNEDFYDCFIRPRQPLDTVYNYIRENPYRLAVRKENPGFFRLLREISIGGTVYQSYGNQFLMDNPFKEAVIVHRANSREENDRLAALWLHTAFNGGVLVSPFISRAEKDVRARAEALGGKFILISNEPFPDRFKPTGRDFELCSAGRLLIIAPKKPSESPLSRSVCLAMNRLAESIAESGWR